MGSTVAELIADAPDLNLAGVWARGENLTRLIDGADVIIDFSLPGATAEILHALSKKPTPLVCGVSGLSDTQTGLLKEAARSMPIVYDRNMSLGIAILQRCVSEAAKLLGEDFKVRICETHHVHKKDAPSGTALQLADAVAGARGERNTNAIDFKVERRGEVPGDHEVVLQSASERLSFAHSVTTRDVFAHGAIRAGCWLHSQPPGLYSMQDVLFD